MHIIARNQTIIFLERGLQVSIAPINCFIEASRQAGSFTRRFSSDSRQQPAEKNPNRGKRQQPGRRNPGRHATRQAGRTRQGGHPKEAEQRGRQQRGRQQLARQQASTLKQQPSRQLSEKLQLEQQVSNQPGRRLCERTQLFAERVHLLLAYYSSKPKDNISRTKASSVHCFNKLFYRSFSSISVLGSSPLE